MSSTKNFDPSTELSIHPHTVMGSVSLTVSSLANQVNFYQEALGLQIRRQEGGRLTMGTSQKDLLELVENPTAARRPRTTTGLYHFAVLYPDRRELARAIARLYSLGIPNYPTDHIMTKTTYLDDLEGNGIELYCESPEDGAWSLASGTYITRRADGSLSSGREPLDVTALFHHLQADDPLDNPVPDGIHIGHIHLHVSDLDQALAFYHGILGFDEMGQDNAIGMAFVSAGGYHHHIGLNTWQGKGVPPPPEGSLGLRYFTIELPSQKALNQILARIDQAGLPTQQIQGGTLLRDPSKNGVVLTVKG